MIRFGDEINKCYRRANGKASVPRLQSLMLSVASMTGAIEAAKLC